MKFTTAWASAAEGAWGAWQTIDGVSDKGDNLWNALAHQHARRTLLLIPDKPIPAGADLSVRIICRSQWGQHVPGCLRAAVVADTTLAENASRVGQAQLRQLKDGKFTWWDTAYCPRIALMDSEGRAVACESKPRLGLTPATLAARVKELKTVRENRDALWARAEKSQGAEKAELLRQSLDLLGFANWAGNENCYKTIHDKIREADPKDESGAVRWLGFGGDPRNGVPWTEPSWAKALEKKDLTDADYQEALGRIDKEVKDPRNKALDHERIQRIMVAKYHVYKRWPKHEDQQFETQREIASFDPGTFWGIGATGYIAMFKRSTTPMLTYGWAANQVKPGVNAWDMTDTPYFFDHAGPYKFRLTFTGGKDALKVNRVALLDGKTVLAEAKPEAEIGPGHAFVEVDLDYKDWRDDLKPVLRVEATAAEGHTDINGNFGIEPQLLPPATPAKKPGTESDIDKLLARGDSGGLQQKLAEALVAEAAKDADGADRIVTKPGLRMNLAQHEMLLACSAKRVSEIAARDGGAAFLQELFKDTIRMESFLASDKADWPQALDNLSLLDRHCDGLDQPIYGRLATALALQWGNGSRYRLVDRFQHVVRAHRGGLLHASFDNLTVREMRWAVPTFGTAKDYQFLLDDRQQTRGEYFGACWAVAYTDPNVYGDSVQGWTYIAPWTHHYGTGTGNRPFPAHRLVGGVCGTLSGFGSAVAQVHGLMSTTVGQPGHCAYIIRVGEEWPVGFSVTWPTAASAPAWEGTGYSTLHRLYEPVTQDRQRVLAAARLTWLAHVQADRAAAHLGALTAANDPNWAKTYQRAIDAQPTNYATWLEYVKAMEAVKDVPPKTWLDLGRRAAKDLSVCNEAGWAMVMRCLGKVLPSMTPAERMNLLLECNQELRQENWVKPEGFPYDGILNWQADRLGDPALAVQLFGKLLAIHHSQKPECNWIFGNVLGWGANRFAGNPATAPAYAQAMAGFFESQGDTVDKKLLSGTLATGIRKASEAGDINSFRLWSRMAGQMLPPLKPEDVHLNAVQAAAVPKHRAFPGKLLSKDGMLRTSSACQFDRPFSYSQVLSGGFGGWFDTNSEEKPWAEVQLAGDARLSGIVLLNRYEYASTQDEFQWAAPLKVQVSPDGKTWTEIASFDKAEAVFTVDLKGKNIRARYVRVERLPNGDKKKPPGRLHLRSFLVYGQPLY